MLNKWSLVSVSLATLALCGASPAVSKHTPHRSAIRTPSFHSMTQMPDSRLVAGYRTDSSGPIYTDIRDKVIGRMNLDTGKVMWLKPSSAHKTFSR